MAQPKSVEFRIVVEVGRVTLCSTSGDFKVSCSYLLRHS